MSPNRLNSFTQGWHPRLLLTISPTWQWVRERNLAKASVGPTPPHSITSIKKLSTSSHEFHEGWFYTVCARFMIRMDYPWKRLIYGGMPTCRESQWIVLPLMISNRGKCLNAKIQLKQEPDRKNAHFMTLASWYSVFPVEHATSYTWVPAQLGGADDSSGYDTLPGGVTCPDGISHPPTLGGK